MTHVREQVLAASRSRTGWFESNIENTEHQPYINDIKSNFESKMQEKTEKKNTGNKIDSTRKKGTRVSTIANMFQSLSPQKGDCATKPIDTHRDISKVYPKKIGSDTLYGGREFGRPERHTVSDSPHHNSVSSLSRSESHLTRFNNARAMFERLQEQTKKSSKSIDGARKGSNSGSMELLSTSSPSSDVSSQSSFTPSPISSSEDSVATCLTKLSNDASFHPKSSENIIGNHSSILSEKAVKNYNADNDSNLTDNCSDSIKISPKDVAMQSRQIDITYKNNKTNKDNTTSSSESLKLSSLKTVESSYCNGLWKNSDQNCILINSESSPCENEIISEERSTSPNSESSNELLPENLSSTNFSTFHNQMSSTQTNTEETVITKTDDTKLVSNGMVSDETSSEQDNQKCSTNVNQEEDSQSVDGVTNITVTADVITESDITIDNSAKSQMVSLSDDEINLGNSPLSSLPNGYTSPVINNENIQNKVDSLINEQKEKQCTKPCAITNENNADDILRVTDGIIEIVPHESVHSSSKSQLYLPNLSEQLRTQDIFGRHLFPNPSQFSQELARRIKDSPDDGIGKKVDNCDLTTWINNQHISYKDWEKEYETSEPSTDHEDSQAGSPYETGGSLRDAAGETLAEFECREHELFLVEAVLGSDDQGCQSGPFPSPPRDRVSNVDVELMTQEEADKLLSKSSRQSLLSDEEAREVVLLLTRQRAASNSDLSETSGSVSAPSSMYEAGEEEDLAGEAICDVSFPSGTSVVYEDVEYHLLPDGHYFTEQPGLSTESDDDDDRIDYCNFPQKKAKVKFSTEPIKVFSTHSIEDYDRRNDDVDPVSASAEYELEKRIEKMDVFPVDIIKGPEGLGLSIIGMGVGADAGLEKLGIFVKTVTEGGAAHRDNRIRVSDQIIEVDGKSLVGVTQAYAASVLRNTSGMVRFLIGREKDVENSEIAQLISQSLQADRERAQHQGIGHIPERIHREEVGQGGDSSSVSQDSTPEEGEDGPTVEVFDLANDSSDSMSPDTDVETLKVKLREAQYRNAVAEAELRKIKEKLMALERIESERIEFLRQLEAARLQLQEAERTLQVTCQEMEHYRQMLEENQGQFMTLERKYVKAKKLIKEFQLREQDFIHQEEYHIQQLQEKDQEYNALVKALKDRVILLEHDLTETQKTAGIPLKLPYTNNMKQIMPSIKNDNSFGNRPKISPNTSLMRRLEIDVSDGELSDNDTTKYVISPDEEDDENSKRSTVERKPLKEDCFDKAVPQTELLDISAAKAKAELASKGSLANRQPPTLKKQSSNGSMEATSPVERRSSESSLCDDSDDELILRIHAGNNTEGTNLEQDNSENVFVLTAEHIQFKPENAVSGSSENICPPFSPSNVHTKPMTFVEEIKAAVLERQAKARKKAMVTEDDEEGTAYDVRKYEEMNYQHERYSEFNSAISEESLSYETSASEEKSSLMITDVSWSSSHSPSNVSSERLTSGHNDEGRESKLTITGSDSLDISNNADLKEETEGVTCEKEDRRFSTPAKQKLGLSYFDDGMEKDRKPHHWQNCPVHQWTATQVGQWLLALGLEQYIPQFIESDVTGQILLQVDSARLKVLGVTSSNDRSLIKKKVKEMRSMLEKERKAHEKEQRAREKLQKKAEKAAKKK